METKEFEINDTVLNTLSTIKVEIGDTYHIRFFPSKDLVPVTFEDTSNQNLSILLENLIRDEEYIALDLEWDPDWSRESNNPIALFQIGTSKGALIIKNARNKSPIMQTFLTSHTFYMKGISCDIKKLSDYLGPAFSSMEIIDVETAFLRPNGCSLNFEKMVETFVSKPTASFKDKKISRSKWSKKLNLKQICYAAFDVVGLFESLPKMTTFSPTEQPKKTVPLANPETEKDNSSDNESDAADDDNDDEIQDQDQQQKRDQQKKPQPKNDKELYIDDTLLNTLSKRDAQMNQTYHIQFFPNKDLSPVTFTISHNKDLAGLLENLTRDEEYIVLDLEWDPDWSRESNNPIALFQIGTSKGALIIKNARNKSPIMQTFLTSHTFYMKGISCDIKKLSDFLGPAFSSMEIIDVETAFLRPNGCSLNFEKMVETFASKPTASFKSKKISRSKWSGKLNLKQICYAAFDVVGLFESLPNMISLANGVDSR